MTMICFNVGDTCFNYRVAGIALRANQVLLNRAEDQNFWFLPGGRVEMGETAIEALRREMQEEVQAEVEVGRLLWMNENFFKDEEKLYHQSALAGVSPFMDEEEASAFVTRATLWLRQRNHSHQLSHQVANREARIVHVGAAITTPTSGFDSQGSVRPFFHSCQPTHAQCVERVRLLNVKPVAIPAGTPSAPGGDRQAKNAQLVTERVACGVHRSGITQRMASVCFHFRVAELGGGLVGFGGVARMATERQVAHPITPPTAAGPDMIEFEGRVSTPAIRARSPKLLQHIRAHFPSGELAALLFNA